MTKTPAPGPVKHGPIPFEGYVDTDTTRMHDAAHLYDMPLDPDSAKDAAKRRMNALYGRQAGGRAKKRIATAASWFFFGAAAVGLVQAWFAPNAFAVYTVATGVIGTLATTRPVLTAAHEWLAGVLMQDHAKRNGTAHPAWLRPVLRKACPSCDAAMDE